MQLRHQEETEEEWWTVPGELPARLPGRRQVRLRMSKPCGISLNCAPANVCCKLLTRFFTKANIAAHIRSVNCRSDWTVSSHFALAQVQHHTWSSTYNLY